MKTSLRKCWHKGGANMFDLNIARKIACTLIEKGATADEIRKYLDCLAGLEYISWTDNLLLRLELLEEKE